MSTSRPSTLDVLSEKNWTATSEFPSISLKQWCLREGTADSNVLLLDGGVSTHLEDLFLPNRFNPVYWSSSLLQTEEGRKIILQGHKAWLQAGVNILSTVTYQCHFERPRLQNTTHSETYFDTESIGRMLQDGVLLAKKSIRDYARETGSTNFQRYVVASIGCYGAAMADGSEYTGNYKRLDGSQTVAMTLEDLQLFHKAKLQILWKQHPDGIALETVPCLLECEAYISVLKQQQQKLQQEESSSTTTNNNNNNNNTSGYEPACWISFACRNDSELNDGSSLESALQKLDELDPNAETVHAVGINCCDFRNVQGLLRLLVHHLASCCHQRGIVVYPNSGEEWDGILKTWKPNTGCSSPEAMGQALYEQAIGTISDVWMKHAPASLKSTPPTLILGGCCRTRPEMIATFRRLVDSQSADSS